MRFKLGDTIATSNSSTIIWEYRNQHGFISKVGHGEVAILFLFQRFKKRVFTGDDEIDVNVNRKVLLLEKDFQKHLDGD